MATERSAALLLGLLVLGICHLVTAQGNDFDCPMDQNHDCIDGYYPDPNDCGSYYVCAFCQHRHEQCPSGEHFSPVNKTCMSPGEADCMGPATTVQPGVSTEMAPEASTKYTTTSTVVETTKPRATAELTEQETAAATTTAEAATTSFPNSSSSAVGITRQKSADGPADPLTFSTVLTNAGNAYNPSTGEVRIPVTGTYFWHLSAGAKPGKPVQLQLQGVPYSAVLDRDSNAQLGTDTLSIGMVSEQVIGDELTVRLPAGYSVYSDSFMQTSLSAFNLDEYMTQTVAFMAAAPGSVTATRTPIPFTNVLVNVGGGFDGNTKFVSQQEADYYFNVNIGVAAATSVRVRFIKNSALAVSELWRASENHNGPDTISKGIVIHLLSGESIEIVLESGSTYNGDTIQTSLAGFMVAPATGSAHSWCVQATTSFNAPADQPLDPLPFQVEILNNNMWQSGSNTVLINLSGLYFIQFSAGAQNNLPVDVRLMVNYEADGRSVDIYRSVPYNNYYDTLSRGILIHLNGGDSVRLILASETGVYSDTDGQTTFLGFFVSEA